MAVNSEFFFNIPFILPSDPNLFNPTDMGFRVWAVVDAEEKDISMVFFFPQVGDVVFLFDMVDHLVD